MSLLTSFNAGVAGIQTAQSGLNTTAHNVANTKTEGYTRQQNIQTDTYYQDFKVTDKARMQIGYGSTIAEIRQIRDQFLDREYRTEAGRLEFYDVLYTTELEIEDMLGEMEGVEFNEALTDLFDTIQEITKNPELITQREVFIANAEAFLEKAENVYQEMRNYQVNLNTQIEEQVKDINKIADQIGALNLKIATAESSNLENANDYRDQRNLLMDQLSKYIYYTYNEDLNHMVTIRINNAPLVDDTHVNHLKCDRLKASTQFENSATTQMFDVAWESGGFNDVYEIDKAYSRENDSDVGSLLGILTARGRRNGFYTDIPMREDYVSDYAYSQAVKDYNNTTGNCLLEKMEAQFDLLIHKVVTAINDAFAPNVELNGSNVQDESGTVQTSISATDSSGNAATLNLSNIHVLDASRCPVGADPGETIGTELFVRRAVEDEARYDVYDVSGPLYLLDDNGQPVLDMNGNPLAITQRVARKNSNGEPVDENDVPLSDPGSGAPAYDYKLYVYIEEDTTDVNTLYTLQNLEMNQKVLENYSYLPVKGNEALGNYDTYDFQGVFDNMLSNLREQSTMLDPNALTTFGTADLFKAMVNGLGVQGSIWKSEVKNQESLTNSIEDKRQQVSGVSTDEEMVSLLMYQHAYNAASRYITVIDEMLEHVIERLG